MLRQHFLYFFAKPSEPDEPRIFYSRTPPKKRRFGRNKQVFIEGDIWIDTNGWHVRHTWNGKKWVPPRREY